MQLNSMIRWIR